MIKINKKTITDYFKNSWIDYVVIAGVIFLDLLSKFFVSRFMSLGQTKVIIPNFLNFYYTLNPYAAFSLGNKFGAEGMRIFFIFFVTITTLVFWIFMIASHKERFLCRLPLAMIIGGALGNLYDRIFVGAVRDFIQVEYFGVRLFNSYVFPTFNLADSSLVIGIILFMVYMIFFYTKDEKARQEKKLAASKTVETNINETSDNTAGKPEDFQ